jgi:hypothetical protein
VEDLEKLLKARGDSIAALVVEPLIQGAAGMLVWPEGAFKKMRELTKNTMSFSLRMKWPQVLAVQAKCLPASMKGFS